MTVSRPMRITVLADVFPALSETFVLDQAIALLERGHDVRIIADAPREDAAMHAEVERHGLLPRTRYLALPKAARARLGVVARAARQARLRLPGAAGALWLARRHGEAGGLRTLAAIATFAEAPRPDVVLCHFGPNGAMATRALAALGWAVPVVTIFHGFDLSRSLKQRGPHLYDHLFRRGKMFLPVCETFAERLRALGCPSERIAVQRMGVDLAAMDAPEGARDGADAPPSACTFLCVGRLVEKKGTAHAILAFASAFACRPAGEVRLRIVGDGPLRGDLERLARASGAAAHVEFLGPLPRSLVIAEMRAADALVQASVTAADGDMEGVPVVIAEAMALGKPVLATRHSGIPELVLNGATGRLLDEGDEAGLADAMAWLAANREAAARMGRAGRARLEDGFTAAHWNAVLEDRLRHAASSAAERSSER